MTNYTNIPLPQDTRLYQVVNGAIQQPKLSILSFNNNCIAGNYSDLQNTQLLFELSSQNTTQINVSIYDKNVSSIRSAPYYSLDGFDNGFDHRFLNLSSPTICFFPLIQATDLSTNVNLQSSGLGANYYTINNYTTVLSNTLLDNNYILLKSQTLSAQNQVYRVYSVIGNTITIYDDPLINVLLNQNQTYIFTRAQVVDSFGTSYYGLYNTTAYNWISQTIGLQLPTADYGVTLAAELSSNQINISIFTATGLIPSIGQVVALNVQSSGPGVLGGRSSGIYSITKVYNGSVYLDPIYPAYVFFQQFSIINFDLNSLQPSIWVVNPATVGYNNYLYGAVNFDFITYSCLPLIGNPSLWAQQVGGANDTIIGFTLNANVFNNNYIRHSDIFSITTKVPTWAANNSVVEGMALLVNYSTNILPFEEYAEVS